MSEFYSATDFYYVVQPYQGSAIFGVFTTLKRAKEATEKAQAELGYYVKFDETNNITWVNRFDGTVVYSISPVERDVMIPIFKGTSDA